MKLYWSPQTRAVRAVWMLEELGEPYEKVLIDIRSGDKGSAEFRLASPMGKVPALSDGDTHLAESAAICLYLADKYASGRLAPCIDDTARGEFLYWMFYAPAVIEPAMSEKFSGAKPNRGQHGWGDFDSMITTWETRLADRPWIMGDAFTAADVMAGSSAVFMKQFGILPDSELLNSYGERCLARPAYRQAMEAEKTVA